MNYFDNCSVGDKVWDYVYGKGKITGIFKDQPTDYPVYVKFKLSDCNFSFSLSGKIDLCNNELPQRLFYYDNRPIVITQDDLDISADSGSYRLSSLGIDQITKEKSEFGAYGNSGCNFKDYNYSKYTRKVHREEPKLVPDDLDEEFVGDTSEPEPISEVTQALYDGYEIIKMEQPLQGILRRITDDIWRISVELNDVTKRMENREKNLLKKLDRYSKLSKAGMQIDDDLDKLTERVAKLEKRGKKTK